MSILRLALRSLAHYWRANLIIVLGVAISAMVLTGTLIVGDSVDHSLLLTAELRLGKIAYSFSGSDRYFSTNLAAAVKEDAGVPVASLMQIKGIASSQGGQLRVNNIDVQGIDPEFLELVPEDQMTTIPGRNEAFVSQNLADRLQLKIDDSFLLRVEKVSLIPKNAPFISDDENQVSLRLTVKRILGPEELGRFNLKTSQTAPFNVFLSLDFMNDRMDTQGKANRLLIGNGDNIDSDQLLTLIHKHWTLEDSGLRIDQSENGEQWNVESDRVFIDPVIVDAVQQFEDEPSLILTYLANSLSKGSSETPYSFVSAGPFTENPVSSGKDIIINAWLAADLNAVEGDSILMKYYSIGPLRQLEERAQWFVIRQIVPILGKYADGQLMPSIPGLSDAGSCREWEAGIPIDLEKIRDKDEDYWTEYRGTPKAFIDYDTGKELWENRFGACTAIRLDAYDYVKTDIEENLLNHHSPADLGYQLRNLKLEGIQAAGGGVDFSELFFGMSFFLLIASLTLLALLINIHLENRISQIGTLKALGYPAALVRRMIVIESAVVVIGGVILGSILAIGYNRLIFKALNTVWSAIVRTSVLTEDIRVYTILTGIGIGFLLAFTIVLFNAIRKLRLKAASLQRGIAQRSFTLPNRYVKWIGITLFILSMFLVVREFFLSTGLNAGIFFLSGGLILIAFILLVAAVLNEERKITQPDFTISALALSNLRRNRARSLRIVILFALGTFVVVSTGLNRKDLYSDANDKSSGTGGFLFYSESTMPVLHDLNDTETKQQFDIADEIGFVQMRISDGDDASCLNLNRISRPRILGVPSEALDGRFSFIRQSEEFEAIGDWSALKVELEGGVVPAIADQTVIQWGLGLKVGDTIMYKAENGDDLPVKLIGGLANSIFQGNILIDEEIFLKHFPSSSGIHVFLVESGTEDRALLEEELKRSFRNSGLEIQYTADRLAEFNSVENTYLSIFLLLGGLGMILGTFGLGLSLVRNIQDRRQELGLLGAVGFPKGKILGMLTREHALLLSLGILIGALGAFIATVPSVFSDFIEASWQTALILIALILFNGLLWILFIGKSSLDKNMVESLRTE